MRKTTKSMITGAAMAGLIAGVPLAHALAAKISPGSVGNAARQLGNKNNGCSSKSACNGKHSCKGKNLCKGQGGCKSSDKGCQGKNSCEGKGGCNSISIH